MSANTIVPSAVTVGATAVVVSAWRAGKLYTMVEAASANTGIIYVGDSTVTTAIGFGELAAGQVITIQGAAAVYCIASAASQAVRVLEGRS
jgi:hypothetical protein